METGYYWIKKNEFSDKEIAKYDSKRKLFFTIGSTYGLTISDIDYKEPLCDGKKANTSESNCTIHGVIARFLKDKAKEHNTEQSNIVAGIMQDDLYVWDYDGGRAMSLQWQTKDIIDLNGL